MYQNLKKATIYHDPIFLNESDRTMGNKLPLDTFSTYYHNIMYHKVTTVFDCRENDTTESPYDIK